MLPPQIANQSVIRLRSTSATDEYNDSETTWPDSGPTISGCSVQPLVGDENVLGRDAITSRWTLYAPPDADILSTDRIRFDGDDYEVDGSVQKWYDPTGSGLDHKRAILKLVEG